MMPKTYHKILLYCSEVLCLETLLKDNANVESRHFLFQPVLVQVKFAKYILGVNKTASNLRVLGELGMIPCFFAFLHKSSVALVKLPEGLNNIPKYLYSLVISST
jgi:hypothetical protein